MDDDNCKICITAHAKQRFRELAPIHPNTTDDSIHRIITALYHKGMIWGGGQVSKDFFVRSTFESSRYKEELVFVVIPVENKRVIKTVLKPEHAEANVELMVQKHVIKRKKSRRNIWWRNKVKKHYRKEKGFEDDEKMVEK
jgi:hypothetical protein